MSRRRTPANSHVEPRAIGAGHARLHHNAVEELERKLAAKDEELAQARNEIRNVRLELQELTLLKDKMWNDKQRLLGENRELRGWVKQLDDMYEKLERKSASLQGAASAPEAAPTPFRKDKERKELELQIRFEKEFIENPARSYSPAPSMLLLNLLKRRLEELNETPNNDYKYSSNEEKLEKLSPAASAKYYELINAMNLETNKLENRDLPSHTFYVFQRPYLYVLYGGNLDEVDKLVEER